MHMPRIVWRCGRILGWFIRPLRLRAIRQAEARTPSLIREVNSCTNREELQTLLGSPLHVLSGRWFSRHTAEGTVFVPDRVERYHHDRCYVDLWFRGETVESTSCMVAYSPWDISSGAAHSHSAS